MKIVHISPITLCIILLVTLAGASEARFESIKVYRSQAEAARSIINEPVGSRAVWNDPGVKRGSLVVTDQYTNKEGAICKDFAMSVYNVSNSSFNSFYENVFIYCKKISGSSFESRNDLEPVNVQQKLGQSRAIIPGNIAAGEIWKIFPANNMAHSVVAAHLTSLTSNLPAEATWESIQNRGATGVLELKHPDTGEQCRLIVQYQAGPKEKADWRYGYCLNAESSWYAMDPEKLKYPKEEEKKVREKVHARYNATNWQNISKDVPPEKPVIKAEFADKKGSNKTEAPTKSKKDNGDKKNTPASTEKGNEMLSRFPGIKIAEQCATRPKGAPWGTQEGSPGGIIPLEEYRVTVAHVLRNLKVLYGKLSPEQEAGLNRMWAPFFDHPTMTARTWFARIAPLLDEYVSILAELDGLFPSFQEATADVLIASATGSKALYAASLPTAAMQAERINKAQKRLTELNRQVTTLGDAPNPLAAKCTARGRHKKAIGDEGGIWALLKQAGFISGGNNQNAVGDFYITNLANKPRVEFLWNGQRFSYKSRQPNFDNPCIVISNVTSQQEATEAEGELSMDGREVLSFRGKMVTRTCESQQTGKIKEKSERLNAQKGDIVLFQGKPIEAGDKILLIYTNKKGALNLGSDNLLQPGEVMIQFTNYLENLDIRASDILAEITRGGKKEKGDQKTVFDRRGKGQTEQTGSGGSTGAQDGQDNIQAIQEAIAHHEAIAVQYERNAARWADDAKRQTDPKIRQELEKRAAEIRANASAERDTAASLRTGTLVKTSTQWDTLQHKKLLEGIRGELSQMDQDNRRLDSINKFLLAGEGHLSGGMQEKISAAIKSPNRSAELEKIEVDVYRKAFTDKAQELSWREFEKSQADMELERPIVLAKQATSTAIMLTAMIVPGAGPLAVAYGLGTGYAEDGVGGAVKAGIRMYSPFVDVAMAAYEGGVNGGAMGAFKGAAITAGMNAVMNRAAPHVQRAVTHVDSVAPKTTSAASKKLPDIDAFQATEWRYIKAMENAKTPAEKQAIKKQYETIEMRQEIKAKQQQVLEQADVMARKAQDKDGNVNTNHEAYINARKKLDADIKKINEEYSLKENRDLIHDEAIEAAGLVGNDVKISGGKPKSALSDMDVTASNYQAGKKYVEAITAKHGLAAVEYGDRWVISNDTTVWKPAAVEKAGSSGFEAQVAHGASKGSDKFSTPSSQRITKGEKGGDTRGPVIDNMKKAGEAGLGTEEKKDLHVIGKSVDKAVQVSGAEVPTGLQKQLSALRNHQLPEQAGVVTLGASKAVKERQMENFLKESRKAMTKSYQAANKASKDYEESLIKMKEDAIKQGDMKKATEIQQEIAVTRSANKVALGQIADYAPELVFGTTGTGGVKPSEKRTSGATGWTPLIGQLSNEREKEGRAAIELGNTAAFGDLTERCKAGAKRIEEKLRTVKAGSDEAKHLSELKNILDKGTANPTFAIQQVRLTTGHELSVVLGQLGVAPAKK